MIELPPLPAADSWIHHSGMMLDNPESGYPVFDEKAMRQYGEACARAALEAERARFEAWQVMSAVQLVRDAPSPAPALLRDGWARTILREGDTIYILRALKVTASPPP